jgi:hypothetical protein
VVGLFNYQCLSTFDVLVVLSLATVMVVVVMVVVVMVVSARKC